MRVVFCCLLGLLPIMCSAYGADPKDRLETLSYVYTCCMEQDEDDAYEKKKPQDQEEYWKKLRRYLAVLSVKLSPAEREGKKVVRLKIREAFRAMEGTIRDDESSGAEVIVDCTLAEDGRLLAVPGYDKSEAWNKSGLIRDELWDILLLLGTVAGKEKAAEKYILFDAECCKYTTTYEKRGMRECVEQYYSPRLGRVIWASRSQSTFPRDAEGRQSGKEDWRQRAVLSANEQEVKAHVEQMEARQAREQGILKDEIKPLK